MVNIAVMKAASTKEMEAESPGGNEKTDKIETIIHNETSSSVKETTSHLSSKIEQVRSEMNGEKEVSLGKSSEAHMPSVMNTRNKVKHESTKEEFSMPNEEESPKRKKKNETLYEPPKLKGNVDIFCWRCHKDGNVMPCRICPRVFHMRCARLEIKPTDWICPECAAILKAENSESRSETLNSLTVEQFSKLLRFVIQRMRYHDGSSHFDLPVDPVEYPHYKDFVIKPIDLTLLDNNIKNKVYGSTEAFLADTKWLVHNSIIFNSVHSDLTIFARALVKIAKQETEEIENCPDCYQHAHVLNENVWFIEPCNRPHILLWAKLKGFPFWPGKVMRSVGNMVDVRFFGDHNRAWVPTESCFLYSKEIPASAKNRRLHNLDSCVQEVEDHITKLKAKYGRFSYFPFRTVYNPKKHLTLLADMLPDYKQNTFTEKIANSTEESDKTEGDQSKTTEPVSSLPNQDSDQENCHEAEAPVDSIGKQISVTESKDDCIKRPIAKKRGSDDSKEISSSDVKKPKKEERKSTESNPHATLTENNGNPCEPQKLFKNKQEVTLLKEPRVILHKLKDEFISDFVKLKNLNHSSYNVNSNAKKSVKKKMNRTLISKIFGVDVTDNLDISCESDTDSATGKSIELGDRPLFNKPAVKRQALADSLNVDGKKVSIEENGFKTGEKPKLHVPSVEKSIVKECVELKNNTALKIDNLTDNCDNQVKKETDQTMSENIAKLKTDIYLCKRISTSGDELINTYKKHSRKAEKAVTNVENIMETKFRDKTTAVNGKANLDNNRPASAGITTINVVNGDPLTISNVTKNKTDSVIQVTGQDTESSPECINLNLPNEVLKQNSSNNSQKVTKNVLDAKLDTEVSSSHLLNSVITNTSSDDSHSKKLHKATLNKCGLVRNKKLPKFSKSVSQKTKQKSIINSRELRKKTHKLSRQVHKSNREYIQLLSEGINEKESELTIDDIISAVKEAKTKQDIIKVLEERLTHLDFLHRSKLREMQHVSELQKQEMTLHLTLDFEKDFKKLKERMEEEAFEQAEKLKRKQWCILCQNEAKFHCCFGANYCDAACQEADWPTHMQVCTQYKMRAGDPDLRLSPAFKKLFLSHLKRRQNSEDVYDSATIQDLISNTDNFPKMQVASHASSYTGKKNLPKSKIEFRPKLQTTEPTQLRGVFKIPKSPPRKYATNLKQEVKVLKTETIGTSPNCIILYTGQNSSLHDMQAGCLKQNDPEEDSNNNNSSSTDFIGNSDSVNELRASKISRKTLNVMNTTAKDEDLVKSSGIIQNIKINTKPVINNRDRLPKERKAGNIVSVMNKDSSETSSECSLPTVKRCSYDGMKQNRPIACNKPSQKQPNTLIHIENNSKSSDFISTSYGNSVCAKSALSNHSGVSNTMGAHCTEQKQEIYNLLGSSIDKRRPPIVRHFELPQIVPAVSNRTTQSIQDCNRIHCLTINNKNSQNLSNVAGNVKVSGLKTPKQQGVISLIRNISSPIKKTDSSKSVCLKLNRIKHKVQGNVTVRNRVSAKVNPVLVTPACVNGQNFNDEFNSENRLMASMPNDSEISDLSSGSELQPSSCLVINDIYTSQVSSKKIDALETAGGKSKAIMEKSYQPTDSSDHSILPVSSSCVPILEKLENKTEKSTKTSFTFCEAGEESSLKFTSTKSTKTNAFSSPPSVVVSNEEEIFSSQGIEVNNQLS